MKCIACGAEIEFNVEKQKLCCEYCRSEFDPKEYEKLSKEAKKQTIETNLYTCTNCGAELMTYDDTAITFCCYCKSSMVLHDKVYQENTPKYVVPFKVTKEECIKLYKKKIDKMLFAPKYMKDNVEIQQFRGIYMPFAVYNLTRHGDQSNKGSKYWKRVGDYDYYKDYEIKSNIDFDVDGLTYDVSSNFSDTFSQSIVPYNLKEAEPFDVKYMSGFYADAKDVKEDTYEKDAKQAIKRLATKKMKTIKEHTKYGCSNPKIDAYVKEVNIAYLPVYFLSIKNKKNDTLNYAVINGQTGKVSIELPIDFKKYILASLMCSIVTFIIVNSMFSMSPTTLLLASIGASLISIIISLVLARDLRKHESFENDAGYKQIHKINTKKEKTKVGLLIACIVLCILVLLFNPIYDSIYYFVSSISLLVVLFRFKKIVDKFNELTSRKLSQLQKRGGDKNE